MIKFWRLLLIIGAANSYCFSAQSDEANPSFFPSTPSECIDRKHDIINLEYHSNGNFKAIKCLNWQSDGFSTAWHENGQKFMQGPIKENTMTGEWTRWREDGSILDIGEWHDSVPHGKWTFYSHDEKSKKTVVYIMGKPVCPWTYIDSDGRQTRVGEDDCYSRESAFSSVKRWSLVPSVGLSYVQYKEGPTSLGMWNTTLKGVYSYKLTDKMSFSGNAYGTLFHLKVNAPSRTSVYFLGINTRLDYKVYSGDSWTVSLGGGLFYGKMFVSDHVFGYRNILYPQIYPSVRKYLDSGILSFYVKYVPLTNRAGTFGFDNRELAGGASLELPHLHKQRIILTTDVSSMTFQPSNSIYQIRNDTYSIGVGFGL